TEEEKLYTEWIDWFYNRILNYNKNPAEKVNVPFNFRRPEEWKNLFEKRGMTVKEKDLGIFQILNPEHHWLYVADKTDLTEKYQASEDLQEIGNLEYNGRKLFKPIVDDLLDKLEKGVPEFSLSLDNYYFSGEQSTVISFNSPEQTKLPRISEDEESRLLIIFEPFNLTIYSLVRWYTQGKYKVGGIIDRDGIRLIVKQTSL
ncbi:MAG: hypothetical protein HY606_05605, partial [Planctomycetes bacterium]|nr:hypothetical protein [Planctomycetota bacterium]